jgi:hypothetical protein
MMTSSLPLAELLQRGCSADNHLIISYDGAERVIRDAQAEVLLQSLPGVPPSLHNHSSCASNIDVNVGGPWVPVLGPRLQMLSMMESSLQTL